MRAFERVFGAYPRYWMIPLEYVRMLATRTRSMLPRLTATGMMEICEEGAVVVKVAISDPPVKRFPKMDRLYGVPPAPE